MIVWLLIVFHLLLKIVFGTSSFPRKRESIKKILEIARQLDSRLRGNDNVADDSQTC